MPNLYILWLCGPYLNQISRLGRGVESLHTFGGANTGVQAFSSSWSKQRMVSLLACPVRSYSVPRKWKVLLTQWAGMVITWPRVYVCVCACGCISVPPCIVCTGNLGILFILKEICFHSCCWEGCFWCVSLFPYLMHTMHLCHTCPIS